MSPSWIHAIEDRLCGVLVVVLVILAGVSLVVVTLPLGLELSLPTNRAECQFHRLVSMQGLTNCSQTWASCQPSCSSPLYDCHQVYVQYWSQDNTTSITPLYANVLGCGYDLSVICDQFYQTFVTPNKTFGCLLYRGGEFAVAEGQYTLWDLLSYFVISLVPSVVLVVCCVYLVKRNIFVRGYKKAKKIRKKNTNVSLSFYNKKMLQLQFKKNLRTLKMKNTQNDVKVFDLENAQTTGALILKPHFSTFKVQPPRIII